MSPATPGRSARLQPVTVLRPGNAGIQPGTPRRPGSVGLQPGSPPRLPASRIRRRIPSAAGRPTLLAPTSPERRNRRTSRCFAPGPPRGTRGPAEAAPGGSFVLRPGAIGLALLVNLFPLPGLARSLAGQGSPPPEIATRAQVVSEPVEVGAVFEVEVEVRHGSGFEAAPVLEETLGDFRVFGAAPAAREEGPPSAVGDGRETSRFRIRLGALVLPGDHQVPKIPVGLRSPAGELSLVETDPVPVRVVSSLPPDAGEASAEIHDIRGPFSFTVPPRWGAIAAAAALVALLAAAGWWFFRRRRARPERVVPLPPPALEAEAALAGLLRSRLLEAGNVVLFYERLAGIMKRYAGRRFRTRWSDRTTAEILADLNGPAGVAHAGALPLLAEVLGEADLAKFSEQSFRPEAARSCFREAGVFLDRTRPPLDEEEDDKEMTEEPGPRFPGEGG